jgi:rubredoxin
MPGEETAMKKMTTAAEKKAEALLAAAFEALPKRIVCPKCNKNRAKDAFGLRILARNAKGVPTRIARQSWCAECRGR